MAHTKGEWKAFVVKHTDKYDQASTKIGIVDANGYNSSNIAIVPFRPNGEDFANAHLIAAAPDLLEALKQFDNWLDFGDFANQKEELYHAMKAAIAKAEGK